MEFRLGVLDRRLELLPEGAPCGRRRGKEGEGRAARDGVRLEHAEQGLPGEVVAHALVGAGDDLRADGLALGVVGGEEGGAGGGGEDVGDFPGEVEGVLDAGVGAEAVEGGMAVDGVAEAEAKSYSLAYPYNSRERKRERQRLTHSHHYTSRPRSH